MENEWLKINKRKIDTIKYQLTELSFKNENPGVPIVEYHGLIKAAVLEIQKLQTEVNRLNGELKKKE